MTIPNEAETLVMGMLFSRLLGDRDADLEIGLYTNTGLTLETAAESDLTEPSTGGYARQTLTDGNWTIADDEASHADIDFTASGAQIPDIQGMFIATKAAGGTQRILVITALTSSVTLEDGQTLRVTIAASSS